MEIATRFFEQYHSDAIIVKARLDGNVWIVTATVGMVNRQTKQVRIDANSGRILEVLTNYASPEISPTKQIEVS